MRRYHAKAGLAAYCPLSFDHRCEAVLIQRHLYSLIHLCTGHTAASKSRAAHVDMMDSYGTVRVFHESGRQDRAAQA